jgi:hypothetical protein
MVWRVFVIRSALESRSRLYGDGVDRAGFLRVMRLIG